ncbi:MAG TPA: sugar phosphate isomerase/epimerase [Clostridia bacterium]|nr:sugar phosphate isomerase/epimerase [Clostridia bacterium]
MKISLSTFVYYRYSLIECLKRTKELGYDGVEIWGGRPHAYWEDMTAKRIAEVRSVLNDLNLEISNFIPAQFRYPVNIACVDEEIRKGSVDYIKRNIDVAEKLESPYVSLCPGYGWLYDERHLAYNALRKSIDEIIAHNKGNKTKLLMEPAHPMETDMIVTVDDALKLIAEVGKENLGICVDTGHLFVNGEDMVDCVNKTQGYTVHYHIDDNFGKSDDHLVPGEGSIDFKPFIDALNKHNYKGYLAVELGFGYTLNPDKAVKNSIEYIKSIK